MASAPLSEGAAGIAARAETWLGAGDAAGAGGEAAAEEVNTTEGDAGDRPGCRSTEPGSGLG